VGPQFKLFVLDLIALVLVRLLEVIIKAESAMLKTKVERIEVKLAVLKLDGVNLPSQRLKLLTKLFICIVCDNDWHSVRFNSSG
jgi:hypothetical protein